MLCIETTLTANEQELGQMLAVLPPSWRARAERYKPFSQRLRSAIGYTMLARMLQEFYEVQTLPVIATDEHGKPHFIDCPLRFSLSHCKTAVACAVDILPIAVDVQDTLTVISPALATRIASPDDAAAMDARTLIARWTQKEASAKLDGRGLKIGLENLPMSHHRLETKYFDTFCLCIAKKEDHDDS